MSWQIEIPLIIRSLINDFDEVYSDSRLVQTASIAARYTIIDLNLDNEYTIDVVNNTISPDPCGETTRDNTFVSFVALRSSCLLDQSTFRTKAIHEGIKAGLGPANLQVSGNLAGYKTVLDVGPCYMYEHLKQQHNIGNATAISAILSPFVGNNFDPRYLFASDLSPRSTRDGFYT